MKKLKHFAGIGLTLLAFIFQSIFFAPLAFAGGGLIEPISIQGPNGQTFAKPGEAFTLTFRVHVNNDVNPNSPAIWCKQCPVKIVFINPQGGDAVNPVSDKTDDNGEITAKVSSSAPYIRYAHVIATIPGIGEYEGSRVLMNFTGKLLLYPESDNPIYNLPTDPIQSPSPTSIPTPSNPTQPPAAINAWLLHQESVGGNKRNVTVKWGAFDGHSGTFKIYAKTTSNKNDWEESFDGSKGPSAQITLRANQDYHIKVSGCMDKWGTCADSNTLTLLRLENNEEKKAAPDQKPVSTPAPVVDNSNSEDALNQKVASLEAQLNESRKQQNILSQRVNDLVNFIKSLFPFFK